MASRRAQVEVTRLWQLPLLVASLGLFAYAAYLFIDPKPGLTIGQRIDQAEAYLHHDRPEAAIEELNRILNSNKLAADNESRVHLLLASSIETGQKLHHLNLQSNHERIIEQTELALSEGARATSDTYRRLGESYEALGKPSEALESYRRAIAIDSTRALALQRKVIDLQLEQPDTAPAAASIEDYLNDKRLTDAERAWALGEKAQILANRGSLIEARAILDQALRLDPDPVSQGVAHYHQGYCAWKLGDLAQAERFLRVARDQLKVSHPLDAEAAYLLGKIRQEKQDPKEAISFYQEVLVSHPESRPAPLALLGRAQCRVQVGESEPALFDLHQLVNQIQAKPSRAIYKQDVIAGLRQAAGALVVRQNLQGALEALADEQNLNPDPGADFYARLGAVYEGRADQVDKQIASAPTVPDKLRLEQQVRSLRTHAGEAYVALSRKLTLTDDKGQGEALWHGVDLYDRAGAMTQAISALEMFAAERPDDGLAPEALLRLGRAYQATGQFDKAIGAFERNQFRYPQSLAASKSGVPLAQAYIAKGPENYSKAEHVLMNVVENNPILTPEAEEFRQALFELSQLYYRTKRYEEAVARLEEMTQRYPNDTQSGQIYFLMADSYRKSAALLSTSAIDKSKTSSPGQVAGGATAQLASVNPNDAARTAAEQAEAAAARRDRLSKAKRLFDHVVEIYQKTPPAGDLDKLYLKLASFYRADCLYDLGQYEEAIKLYDNASMRYQDDPAALAAYVQIVNSYCALGRMEDAKTANERAKWLLRKMPPEAFEQGKFSLPKEYWDDWLKWTSESGMWKQKSPGG